LAYDPQLDAVLIAHQKLLPNVPTTRDRIFWGQVISSLLRSVQVDHLLEGTPDGYSPIGRWTVEPLGGSGRGGSDPAGMALDASGRRVICLAGVDQIAISSQAGDAFQRVDVGDHPVAVVVDDPSELAYVANRLDDSISIVDLSQRVAVTTVSLGPTPPPDAVHRGERLFYDARLSLDGWMSCHSCHPDGHTNGLLNDNFGDDVEGTPKRVLSLLGSGQTGPWSWLGKRQSLEEQIAKSIQTTMRGAQSVDGDSSQIADLAAYLRTLDPPPSVPRARAELDPLDVERGRRIFDQLQCADCHAPDRAYTTPATYAVGLQDEAGNEAYNPPSLRGVDQRHAWFHDGRATTLDEVFLHFGHPQGTTGNLTADQVDWLVAFLQSL
jgi:cytochrome c peroxidase